MVLTNNGAFTFEGNAVSEKFFFEQLDRLRPVAAELGLPLIGINTNSGDYNLELNVPPRIRGPIVGNTPMHLASAVYALQKLFSKYYIASSKGVDKFSFKESESYDALLYYTKIMSIPNGGITFYGSGLETNRIGKVDYICRNEIVQKHLSLELGINYSRNKKCIRTMFELYSLNMLEPFSGTLNVEDFKNNLSDRLGWYFSQNESVYIKETIDRCKLNGVKIPKSAYLKKIIFYKPIELLKPMLRRFQFVRKFYYLFNIDVFLNGKEQAEQYRKRYRNDNL